MAFQFASIDFPAFESSYHFRYAGKHFHSDQHKHRAYSGYCWQVVAWLGAAVCLHQGFGRGLIHRVVVPTPYIVGRYPIPFVVDIIGSVNINVYIIMHIYRAPGTIYPAAIRWKGGR